MVRATAAAAGVLKEQTQLRISYQASSRSAPKILWSALARASDQALHCKKYPYIDGYFFGGAFYIF